MRTLACLALLTLLVTAAGCGSNGGGADGSADLAMSLDGGSSHDLFFNSRCGRPGDTGNSKGVGKFCMMQSDCGMGFACSHDFHSDTFFCTLTALCTPPTDTATCGEATVCQCDPSLGGACGCTPAACGALPQG